MCGIVGVIGDLSAKEEGIFKQLLILDTLRGTDSTGVAVVDVDKEVKIAKTVGDSFQLFDTVAYTKALAGKNLVCIGHNRYGTVGKATRKNAHPFTFSNVTGVHNGTLRNKWNIPGHTNFDTDSEALYNQINDEGIDKAIDKIDGAYALVWYDKEEHSVNFLRNKERPLSFVFSEDKKAMFYASELWMIHAIAGREGYKLGEAFHFPEDTLYTYKVPAAGQVFEKAKARSLKPTPFPQKKSTVTPFRGSGASRSVVVAGNEPTANLIQYGKIVEDLVPDVYKLNEYGSYYVTFTSETYPSTEFRLHVMSVQEGQELVQSGLLYTGEVGFLTFETSKTICKIRHNSFKETEVEQAPPPLKVDHQGLVLTQKEFEKRYTECSWCSSPITYEEDWHPMAYNQCVCSTCKTDQEIAQYLKFGD